MRPFAVALALVLAPAMVQAQVTARDIVELSRAGLGEEVLLALIEVHRPVFPVDPETIKTLKQAGVPQNVIVAMVKSGRTLPPEPEPVYVEAQTEPPPPQVVVVEREPRYQEVVREVAVPVPVYVPVRTRPVHVSPHPKLRVKSAKPVYWGFGGKLRPDAWRPTTVTDIQPDAKIPPPQRK